ncbi:MAG: HAD hydrolase-like protein [Nanoarchaeota archaeon]
MFYSNIVFDLDGTLDNQMPSYTAAFVRVCCEFGLPEEGVAQYYCQSGGTPLKQQFTQILSRSNIPIDINRCYNRFWESIEEKANPFDETISLVNLLHQQQRHLYITTGSKTEGAKRRLTQIGLISCFEMVLGQSENIDKGLKQLQSFKESSGDNDWEKKALYLGDGTMDMVFAKEFGIIPVGITHTVSSDLLRQAGAEYTLNSLGELITLLHKLEDEN